MCTNTFVINELLLAMFDGIGMCFSHRERERENYIPIWEITVFHFYIVKMDPYLISYKWIFEQNSSWIQYISYLYSFLGQRGASIYIYIYIEYFFL